MRGGKLYVLEPGASQFARDRRGHNSVEWALLVARCRCNVLSRGFDPERDLRIRLRSRDDSRFEPPPFCQRGQSSAGYPTARRSIQLGGVWSAICEGGKLVRFLADGSIDLIIDMPVRLPGSVMFGGAGLDRLFVPSLDPSFMGRANDPLDGETFVIDGLGFTGLPEPRFAG